MVSPRLNTEPDCWLQPLATWASELVVDKLPERVLTRVADCAIDWWGAVAAGCNHHLAEKYRQSLAVSLGHRNELSKGCSVAGWTGSYLLEQAASANAAISHLAEVDDGHKSAIMHPGVTVFPALMALAECLRPSIADLQAAIVAGYEVGLKVGTLLGKQHYTAYHTTATAGSFGAAAAAARLLGLSPQETLFALGHAGTQASGVWQLLDDKAEEAKAFHPAVATRNGLTAASLARNGIPAATRILEGPRGLLTAWKLDGDPKILSVPDESCFQIETTTIKGWPVCGQMHTSLDVLSELLPQIEDARQIEYIKVGAPKAQLDIANILNPQSFEEAKFSSRFCLAFLLKEGRLDFANFSPEAFMSYSPPDFMANIFLEEDSDFTKRFPKERPARIEIRLKNGNSLIRERSYRKGDPEQPWQWHELVDRFAAIAQHIDSTSQQKVIDWCVKIGQVDDELGDITALFTCLKRAEAYADKGS